MIEDLTGILKKLLDIHSPVGHCDAVTEFISSKFEELGFKISRQRDGAIRARLSNDNSTGNPLIFAAHADTLGAQVKNIKPSGQLELVPLGSLPPRFVEGARAQVHTKYELVTGTILPLMSSGHAFGSEVNQNKASWANLEMRLGHVDKLLTQSLAAAI